MLKFYQGCEEEHTLAKLKIDKSHCWWNLLWKRKFGRAVIAHDDLLCISHPLLSILQQLLNLNIRKIVVGHL